MPSPPVVEAWHGENVSVAVIEKQLARMRASVAGETQLPIQRTSVMTHIAWVPPQWVEAAERTLEGMEESHPSRTIALVPTDGDEPGQPTATTLTGLSKVDDTTFTIKLYAPFSEWPLVMGYNPFLPLPDAAFTSPGVVDEQEPPVLSRALREQLDLGGMEEPQALDGCHVDACDGRPGHRRAIVALPLDGARHGR